MGYSPIQVTSYYIKLFLGDTFINPSLFIMVVARFCFNKFKAIWGSCFGHNGTKGAEFLDEFRSSLVRFNKLQHIDIHIHPYRHTMGFILLMQDFCL